MLISSPCLQANSNYESGRGCHSGSDPKGTTTTTITTTTTNNCLRAEDFLAKKGKEKDKKIRNVNSLLAPQV